MSTIQEAPVNTGLELTLEPYEDYTNEKDHKTHIVNPPKNLHIWTPGMTAQEIVDIARLNGQEVVALCDYRWVPKANPEKYDVCQACMDIAGKLMQERGE